MLLHHPFNFTSKEAKSTFCGGANACTLEQIQSELHTLLALKINCKNIYYQEAQGIVFILPYWAKATDRKPIIRKSVNILIKCSLSNCNQELFAT